MSRMGKTLFCQFIQIVTVRQHEGWITYLDSRHIIIYKDNPLAYRKLSSSMFSLIDQALCGPLDE
jgi:hypothetical protein